MISYGLRVTSQRACADKAASALRFSATADTLSAISEMKRAIGAAVTDSGANADREASGRVHDMDEEDADDDAEEEEDGATDIDEEEESNSTVWHCRRRC